MFRGATDLPRCIRGQVSKEALALTKMHAGSRR